MDILEVAEPYRAVFARLGLNSCEDVARYFLSGEPIEGTQVLVKRAVLSTGAGPATSIFYKQYEYKRPSWKFVGRASKARREFASYAAFERMGLACAERIAAGEERDWLGRLKRAFIVTKEIPAAKTLIAFFQQACADRTGAQSKELRASLLRQLAGMTRRIHEERFFHTDLFWRNILVTWQASAEPSLWWIDCPRGHFRRFRTRSGRIKDLASLDKSAAKFCTRGERLAFVKHYLGKKKLDAEAKRLIRDTLAYRKRRWPDDWT